MTNALAGVSAQSHTTTMSSLEIAKLTEKQHRNVIADIRKTLDEAGIRSADFSADQKFGNNRTRQVFHLPRLECDLVMSGYSVKYRFAIIKRWHELEHSQQAQAQVAAQHQTAQHVAALSAEFAWNISRLSAVNQRGALFYLRGLVAGQGEVVA